jgi:hypothetical protein
VAFCVPALPRRVSVEDLSIVSHNRGHQTANTTDLAGADLAVDAIDGYDVIIVDCNTLPCVGHIPGIFVAKELAVAVCRA